jgi:acyl transferase domain-containing protein/acyl carrier protein
MQPIAIIGIGCRFPGNAHGPDAFWQLLCNGVDAITDIPSDRYEYMCEYIDQKHSIPMQGGFLQGIDLFDPYFFGISPREATCMDPQQRLLLEVAWEALEDSGQLPAQLVGSKTGVFIGMWTNEYEAYTYSSTATIDLYATTGSGRYAAAGRLSYIFDFQGPSLTLDTACSSSLVAVHLACQSLQREECQLALVGGTNIILQPSISLGYAHSRMLSPDGRCHFGDKRANGYVRSEGVGIIVLKPLAAALTDGDPIYAIIRGSATNNDGRSSNLLVAPGQKAQEDVMREAYRSAGIAPGKVGYVEAHGTGTRVGDRVELQALGAVLGVERPPDLPCLIGSVKTNIGHTEAAAGIAGLIKAALCLKYRCIPPSLHFQSPNPDIPWQKLPLRIQRELISWPSGPALAGVNSFGVTGTNAHVVLEEAPAYQNRSTNYADNSSHLFTLSAHTEVALKAQAQAYKEFIQQRSAELGDICYTLNTKRTHHKYRLAFPTFQKTQAIEYLEAFLQQKERADLFSGFVGDRGQPRVAFVFPGQGSQWIGMGKQLFAQEAVFRESVLACNLAMQPYIDWSLEEQLITGSLLSRVDVIQSVIFAIQVALARLWISWGLKPDAVVGHSMGEIAAAHIAGALSLEHAAHVICIRSQLLKRTSNQGTMAVIDLPSHEIQPMLKDYTALLSIAACNSPRSTVLSGDTTALTAIVHTLQQQGIFSRLIRVDVASHSHHVDPLLPELRQALEQIQPRSASIPIYSTVSGEICDGRLFGADYWVRNLREPVLFSSAIQRLLDANHQIMVEVSPHPVLIPAIEQSVRMSNKTCTVLPSLRRDKDERKQLLETLGCCYVLGAPIAWENFHIVKKQPVRLPLYMWQREHFWRTKVTTRQYGTTTLLLQEPLQSATRPGEFVWNISLQPDTFGYIQDHRIQDQIVLPGAAYIDLALSAVSSVSGGVAYQVENLSLKKMLSLEEHEQRMLQLVLSLEENGSATFKFYSAPVLADSSCKIWTQHALGILRRRSKETEPLFLPPSFSREHFPGALPGMVYYASMTARTIHYGPKFQTIQEIWTNQGEAWASIHLPEEGDFTCTFLLDTMFQTLFAALPQEVDNVPLVPVGCSQICLQIDLKAACAVYARLRVDEIHSKERFLGDIWLLDAQGNCVGSVQSLCLQSIEQLVRLKKQQDEPHLSYVVRWEQSALVSTDPDSTSRPGIWLICMDGYGIGMSLKEKLEAKQEQCVMIYPSQEMQEAGGDGFRPELAAYVLRKAQRTNHINQPVYRGFIYLWGLAEQEDQSSLEEILYAQQQGCGYLLEMMKELKKIHGNDVPRLWIVTRNTQSVGNTELEQVAPAQASLWGMSRVLRYEHPEFNCTCIDLAIPTETEIQALFDEIWSNQRETEIALRKQERYVARLIPYTLPIDSHRKDPLLSMQDTYSDDLTWQLEVTQAGIVDALAWHKSTRHKPERGEVGIEIYAASLNFLDVLTVMGIRPGQSVDDMALGIECAGKVVELGEGVETFQLGDEVVAVGQHCFSSYVIVPASLIVKKPTCLSFAEAAAIPVVFLTVIYAFHHLAQLQQGERVLIHSATGGVGMAALQVAQQKGAEIFVTAGTETKREFLKTLGIKYVMDSRSLKFADDILRYTDGQGVDVILNTLTDEAIPASFQVLAPYGRFLEIGKQDIYRNSQLALWPFHKNLSYFAIDLARMFRERPQFVGCMLSDILAQFETGQLVVPPIHTFPASQIGDAFKYMAQAKHIGKIVVTIHEQLPSLQSAQTGTSLLSAEGSYLITGGLGGIGLRLAQWCVQQGARHLVLMSKGGSSSQASQEIAAMQEQGVCIVPVEGDVSKQEDMQQLIERFSHELPRLRGVIHAAGLLDDVTIQQMGWKQLRTVMKPKIDGAWLLHELTRNCTLDFFILFSSAAALLGFAGQANYAAANAFMDALAHYRRSLGLPALSINWGPWTQVGLAASHEKRGARLASRGIGSLTPEQGLTYLAALLTCPEAQVAVMDFHVHQWCQFYPQAMHLSLLKHIIAEKDKNILVKNTGVSLREKLLEIAHEKRQAFLEAHIREHIALVLRLESTRIDREVALGSLGFDSLMALELRNRLEISLGLVLSATLVWSYPTIPALATYLAQKMDIALVPSVVAGGQFPKSDQLIQKVAQLSEDELVALLDQELAEEEKGDVNA